jgi:squalene-hopene/tetraprenyl-beta-curcumene cyclase
VVEEAFELAGPYRVLQHADRLGRAQKYVDAQGGIAGLRARYGKDKTFAVPILTNCALAGIVSWNEVSTLPFELACLPYSLLRFLRILSNLARLTPVAGIACSGVRS